MSLFDSIQSMGAPLMQQLGQASGGSKGALSMQDIKDLQSVKDAVGKLDSSIKGASSHFGNLQDLGKAIEGAAASHKSEATTQAPSIHISHGGRGSFNSLLADAVHHVDEKQKIAAAEAKAVFTGQSDNLHQAVLSMREGQLAFNLLVEVRNHLMDGMQELARLQVG